LKTFEKKQNEFPSNIAILIPSYNEGNRIGNVIKNCMNLNLDIIVVNDGSNDNTSEVLQEFGSLANGRIVILTHPVNKGKGVALITGFDYIIEKGYMGAITIDADGQHDVLEINDFLEEIKKNDPDIIVGSRFGNTKGMPFIRRFVNYFTSWIISSIAGKKIEDVQSGYRFLKTAVLENIKLETKNFDTEPELLLKAGWLDFKITNIPIRTIYFLDDFKSHVNPVKDTIKFFKLVCKSIRWKRSFFAEKAAKAKDLKK
jgi:glycosyltransferase involved in cell wall biosynthesis